MTEWNPSNLCQCVGSEWLGYMTAALSVGVCIWYAIITRRWYQAARAASAESRKVWHWLAIVFVLCSWSGYGTLAMMLVAPKLAISTRLGLLILQNIACPIFLWKASSMRFSAISRNELVGSEIVGAVAQDISDRDLAELARGLVAMSLERYATR